MLGLEYGKHRPLGAAITGDLDGNVTTTVEGVASPVRPETHVIGTLSALVVLDAETTSLAVAAYWQVSDDGSTYYDVAGLPNNAANVALATGTAGADASVTRVLPAPLCVHAWKYARLAFVNTGATGTTNDTFSVKYKFVAA